MSDLDARVAALMGWHDDAAEARHKCGSPLYNDAANFARKALERAIILELQKPALHKPVTLPQRITELVDKHESLRAAARVLGIDPGYLSRLASGEKCEPGATLLRRLGLRQITTYERV